MNYKFTTDKISIDIYLRSAQKYCIIKTRIVVKTFYNACKIMNNKIATPEN